MSTYPVVMNAALATIPPPYYSGHEGDQLVHFNGFPKNIQHCNTNQKLVRSKSTVITSSPSTKLGAAPSGIAERSVPGRRLSSGSACEVCRRRKTKCDGGQPCGYCASNHIECVHRPPRRKSTMNTLVTQQSASHFMNLASPRSAVNYSRHHLPLSSSLLPLPSPYPLDRREIGGGGSSNSLKKQTSCPTLDRATAHWPSSIPPRTYSGLLQEIPSVMDQLSCLTFSTVAHSLSLSSAANPGNNGNGPMATETNVSLLSMTPFTRSLDTKK